MNTHLHAQGRRHDEQGKVGLAILFWLLGLPSFLVLLYLIFG